MKDHCEGGFTMKRNTTLDLIKCISAFAVICIHYMFYGAAGITVKAVARYAVPFFFAVSGLYSWNQKPEKLVKRALGICQLYFFSFLLYFVYGAFRDIMLGKSSDLLAYIGSFFSLNTIGNFFVFNTTISAVHLWFLPALVYCYLLMWLLTKVKAKENLLLILAIILLSARLIFGEGLAILGRHVDVSFPNFLFIGFPFFILGRLLARIHQAGKHSIDNMPIRLTLLILFIGVLETCISVNLWGPNLLYVGSILIVLALLLMALKYREAEYAPWIKRISGLSTHIYVFHVAIGGTIDTIMAKVFHCAESLIWINTKPFIVLFLSIILGLVFRRLYTAAMSCQRQRNPGAA